MTEFKPRDPGWDKKVRDSFELQSAMTSIGAKIVVLRPGYCEIELPYRRDLCQQHGYLHAGYTTMIADTAAGYAAFSLMPPDSSVLTVEFKVNLMAPGAGERFLARGRVLKPGKTVTVTEADVVAEQGASKVTTAKMLATMFCLAGKTDRPKE